MNDAPFADQPPPSGQAPAETTAAGVLQRAAAADREYQAAQADLARELQRLLESARP